MKYYIITLLGEYEQKTQHLFCSLWSKEADYYAWSIGYSDLVVFKRKSDADNFIEDMSITGVLKVEKVFLRGISYHIFNPRFQWKQS